MKRRINLDVIDRGILRMLSIYEHLDLSELWFEIGEAGTLRSVTKEEILRRLQSLKIKGLVKRIALGKEIIRWSLNKSRTMMDGDLQGAYNAEND